MSSGNIAIGCASGPRWILFVSRVIPKAIQIFHARYALKPNEIKKRGAIIKILKLMRSAIAELHVLQ